MKQFWKHLLGFKLTAVTMNGVWKNNCPQFVHEFHGFEKVDEEFKQIFSNLVTINQKLELGLHEDNFTQLLTGHHKKLMSEDMVEMQARERAERDNRKNKQVKDQRGSQCNKWQKDILCLRRPIFEARTRM